MAAKDADQPPQNGEAVAPLLNASEGDGEEGELKGRGWTKKRKTASKDDGDAVVAKKHKRRGRAAQKPEYAIEMEKEQKQKWGTAHMHVSQIISTWVEMFS